MTAVTNVNPNCICSVLFYCLNVPFLHLQFSENSFFLLCNQSIFFTLTCQRRPSLSNRKQRRQHRKKLPFPRLPCLPRSFWHRGLINPGKHSVLLHWFAAVDGQRAARPRTLIDGAASFRHICHDQNIDCWLKPKSIKLTQAAAAPSILPWWSCDLSHEKLTWLHRSPFVNTGTSVCVISRLLTWLLTSVAPAGYWNSNHRWKHKIRY